MATFLSAQLALWLAVVLYVGRLGMRQRRLQRTLEELAAEVNREAERPARAA